ncbi:potassium transporter inner membrane associated protein [Arenimonas maotaiensis]|uniref:Trk system potassium uptake protein TrkA n=1 Tax=Arenimonas maotaiensis TaxID=1446479 RepID=A0A917FQT9_9GAMM|nr:Trk system potassium transporter TrkA [Arenimonas maotaiensis]GGF95484.1 potassium transporter inner membrane associated protein [Arenimonas maotaiensis]
MKILILGAGQVGSSVAAALSVEDQNDITVVDRDLTRLRELTEKLDIRTVTGHASLPSVLEQAGLDEAELLVAVTSSDEVNIIACQIAAQRQDPPTRVARLREQEYLALARQGLGGEPAVTAAISPEELVCRHVERLIATPGALQVLDFAGGRAQLVAVRALRGGALVGHEIRELRHHLPQGMDVRVAAIFRGGKAIKPEGITVIEAGDEVFFLAPHGAIKAMMGELRSADNRSTKRIFISGGGGIGRRLAKSLERRYSVKILERSRDRARTIAEDLIGTIVLVGDCADEDLLREENIDQTDVYCALTNDDEANILSAMLAKRLGCPRVVALINRASYAELVEGSTIDIAISPQSVTLSALLSHIREGAPERVYSLRRGAAEAIEVVVRGDRRTSRVIGRELDELDLPHSATIGGIVRGDALMIAHHDVVIEPGDHVILFVNDKRDLPAVIDLFKEVDWL